MNDELSPENVERPIEAVMGAPKPPAESLQEDGGGTPAKSGISKFFGTWPGDETDEQLLGALSEIRKPVADGGGTLCDTTMTHRAPRTACHCDTYPDNLGPCATFQGSMKEDYCAYCDHNSACHRAHWGIESVPARNYPQPVADGGGLPLSHEWLGAEEVNDWFVASCSCGWTYQHPNYGTSQDTFVNHWGDHILASSQEALRETTANYNTLLDEIVRLNTPYQCGFNEGVQAVYDRISKDGSDGEGNVEFADLLERIKLSLLSPEGSSRP
jgi:hypothetical protein